MIIVIFIVYVLVFVPCILLSTLAYPTNEQKSPSPAPFLSMSSSPSPTRYHGTLGGSGFQLMIAMLGEQSAALQNLVRSMPPVVLRPNPNMFVTVPVERSRRLQQQHDHHHHRMPSNNELSPSTVTDRVDPETLAELRRPDLEF